MKSTMRRGIIFSTFMLLGALSTTSQAADEVGIGMLKARGAGIAAVQGSGKARISGHGVLTIHDVDGDAVVEVDGEGRRVELPNGSVVYFGFRGHAHISGPTFRVVMSGANIRLAAAGKGRVHLEGCGQYVVADDLQPWRDTKVEVELPALQ